MKIERIRALRGPNRWTRACALEAVVRGSAAENRLPALAGLMQRLTSRLATPPETDEPAPARLLLPSLPASDREAARLKVGAGEEAGRSSGQKPQGDEPQEHLSPGPPTTPAHAFGLAAFALQVEAGCPIRFARTIATSDPDLWLVVVEYSEEAVGRLAFELAEALVEAECAGGRFTFDDACSRLRTLDEDERPGPSTGEIIQAARARGIPVRRLTSGSLVQLGWGHRQRRIQAAETDTTGTIAEQIAQDKERTKRLLRDAGIPVPDGGTSTSIEAAWALVQRLGSAVVKPRDGNQGKGVSVNVRTREQLANAWANAARYGDGIIVERHVPGSDYRLLVIGWRLVAAARRDPPAVIGDGIHSIRELVAEINRDPRRSEGHATALTRIPLDAICEASLAASGLSPESLPAAGTRVVLRNNANLSTGGTAVDVTDEVHPEVAARAIEAARTVGLDICGVDIVCESISRPLEEQGGCIVEVNAAPGLRMHITPSWGKGRAIGEAVMTAMFEAGDDARIPLVAVTGTNGKTTTVRLIAHLLGRTGLCTAMTTTDGIYVDGRRIDDGDCSGPRSARNVLLNPQVEAAVLETARGGLLREGLGFDRCRVAVVTNIGDGDHLGMDHVDDADTLAAVKSVIVQNVSIDGYAVLNADDPRVVAMAPVCPGAIVWFTRDATTPVAAVHLANGGRIVHLEGNAIVCESHGAKIVIPLSEVAITRAGTIGFQVQNAMAAIGAAWALSLDWDTIRAGLREFVSDATSAPGRFNVFDGGGATIIADYGHNVDAITALVDAAAAIPATRRMIVISGAGDRRDEDLRRQTQRLGDAFDEVILYEDQCQRGRADGEVIALLRAGLAGAARTRQIREIHGEAAAIDAALDAIRPGELCLILIDQVETSLAQIARRTGEMTRARAVGNVRA